MERKKKQFNNFFKTSSLFLRPVIMHTDIIYAKQYKITINETRLAVLQNN